MQNLNISPHFTLEDIRKVRDRDYEMTKDMTTDEMIAYYHAGAERFLKGISELKDKTSKPKKSVV